MRKPAINQSRKRGDAELVRTTCDGCGFLVFEEPAKTGAPWLACCTDVDESMHGLRRVVDAAQWKPFSIPRPLWCERGETE